MGEPGSGNVHAHEHGGVATGGTAVWPRVLLAATIVAAVLVSASTFTVRQGFAAIVTLFGAPRGSIMEPGLHFKWPWPIESVRLVDCRTHAVETRPTETLTQDKKNVIVTVSLQWKVADPLAFYKAMKDTANAEAMLRPAIGDARNAVIGRHPISALVSTSASDLKHAGIEAEIARHVQEHVGDKFGISAVGAMVRQISVPKENTRFILQKMAAERKQYAAKYRAEGQRIGDEIRAQTDRERAEILAEAYRKAEEIRGEADAEAARLYAEAHGKDPEFYEFVRSLDALRRILGAGSTVILDADAMPFRLLKAGPSGVTKSMAVPGPADGPGGRNSAGSRGDEGGADPERKGDGPGIRSGSDIRPAAAGKVETGSGKAGGGAKGPGGGGEGQ
ncbi:MAG: protease modulator HflC [Planctomycetota bacterium]|nr:protease modulator HflC [Planctomycetota bacterium]